MSDSKYGHLIDLHNKAIDILEKRNSALTRLEECEANIEKWLYSGTSANSYYTLQELKWMADVQRRYISLLSRAYSRLASSVCETVAEPVVESTSDVVNDLILLKTPPVGYEWRASSPVSTSMNGVKKGANFFELMGSQPSSAEIRDMLKYNPQFDNEGKEIISDAPKAD